MDPHADPHSWQIAQLMPALNSDLKTIVARPFIKDEFVHLAVLQHRARQLALVYVFFRVFVFVSSVSRS